MYAGLVSVTISIIFILAGASVTPIGKETPKKTEKLASLILIVLASLLSLAFTTTTTTVLSKTPDVKQSKQSWRVIYKNNINADVKIESCRGLDTPITPKSTVSKEDFDRFMPVLSFPWNNKNEASVNITATNDVDSTTKTVTLPKSNIIETWPKGMKPNKSKGHITKIEYRSTPVTRKWFTIPVDKTDYKEIRITIEYEGQKEPSTTQLFGDD